MIRVKYNIDADGVIATGYTILKESDFDKVMRLLGGVNLASPTISTNQIDLEDMIKDVEESQTRPSFEPGVIGYKTAIIDNLTLNNEIYPGAFPESADKAFDNLTEDHNFPGTDNI